MRDYAIVCPGQGTQSPDMFDLVAAHPRGLAVLQDFGAALGRDLVAEAQAGTGLHANAWAQPALVALARASWEILAPELPAAPAAFAGYSVGEVSAWSCAGAWDVAGSARLAATRAALMDAARPARQRHARGARPAAAVGSPNRPAPPACTWPSSTVTTMRCWPGRPLRSTGPRPSWRRAAPGCAGSKCRCPRTRRCWRRRPSASRPWWPTRRRGRRLPRCCAASTGDAASTRQAVWPRWPARSPSQCAGPTACASCPRAACEWCWNSAPDARWPSCWPRPSPTSMSARSPISAPGAAWPTGCGSGSTPEAAATRRLRHTAPPTASASPGETPSPEGLTDSLSATNILVPYRQSETRHDDRTSTQVP
ncbi:acyl-carrier-protein S-malonyltransferase-like protein [Methylibium petroleiphilum PM1]|uniref:Acyl-carrier-protein S-malonyltransferase-like protein n=1 Tax=Methylibium petroleiphilum (strain ATCC BAA-1232 / LMG 22953 / PM1) TaxID=420662 RepID=A2SDW1_METPP|nr:acyl-carrier-protein S-malonyltransferase-like protein [Methylibium petroleiphilum PM1]